MCIRDRHCRHHDGERTRIETMGLLRRHDEAPKQRFQMREKLLAIGDDYWIEDGQGQRVFKVDGKVARIRDTWELKDAAGRPVAHIQEKKISVRDKITIEWN